MPVRLPSDEDAIIELEAALVTGATIRIHVVPPADNVHDVGVEVLRRRARPRGYRAATEGPEGEEIGKKPTELAFDALSAGRYRARDAMTGLVSEPADVAAGASAELTLRPLAGRHDHRPGRRARRREGGRVVVIEGAGLSRRSMGPIADRGSRSG